MQEEDRYSRQRLLPEFGDAGQKLLAASRAIVVGCGALGTAQAALLVRAGLGETVLIDRDLVELSNLQRQYLFDERDAARGRPKAVAAARRLARINSSVRVVPVVADLTPTNAETLLKSASIILDGTDNYGTRYLINDVAVKRSIPWVYGAAVGTKGSVMPVIPGRTACLACLFPAAPQASQPTCDTVGVLNAGTSMIAALQVAAALKILVAGSAAVSPRLASYDLWAGESSSLGTDRPAADCAVCARREFATLNAAPLRGSARLCGRGAVQVHPRSRTVDLQALAGALARVGPVRSTEHMVRFDCPPHELTVFPDGRAIVKGTSDLGIARSLYARYVGE